MRGEKEEHKTYNPETDEYSDQMMSPFRLLHISKVTWDKNKYSGYAILIKKENGIAVSVKLKGNRSERRKMISMLDSLEKLVRIEHSIATKKGFMYKDPLSEDQIDNYEAESKRIRNRFNEIGVVLP